MIKFSNVHYDKNDRVVLLGASFTVQKNKKLLIYYDHEGGATTISKLICGLIEPSGGTVRVENKKPTPKTVGATLLLSNPIFLEGKTALANLEYVAKVNQIKTSKESLVKLLSAYSILPNDKPKKMNSKQRLFLALARARVRNANIVVADNIFLNINQKDLPEAKKRFLELSKDKTVVMFSTNHSIKIKGASTKYLHQGKLYSFEKPYKILPILQMMEKNATVKEGTLKSNKGKIFLETNLGANEIKNATFAQRKAAKASEKVCFATKNNKIVGIFDYYTSKRL